MNSESNTIGRAPQHPEGQDPAGSWLRDLRALAGRTKIAIITILTMGAVFLATPAQSQTGECSLTESWTNGDYIEDDSGVTSTLSDDGRTVTVTGSATREICSVFGIDSGAGSGWNDTAAPFTHTAPEGSTIQSFFVETREVTTTTSGPSTSSTSSTSTSSTSSTSSTTSTSTTTTTVAPPRGPGNGPIAIRPEPIAQSSPDAAALLGFERVDVAVQGSDGYYWTFWNGSSWTEYAPLGGPPEGTSGDPAIVSWAPGRLDVFVRGANDGRLWQTFSVDGGVNWSGWIKPLGDDGELASGAGPEVSSRGPDRLDVFVRGTDGQIWQRFYDGAWNDGWIPQGRPDPVGINGEPGVASWDSTRVDLFVRGSDDKLWQKFWDGAAWSAWFQPVGESGTLASSPDVTSWEPGNLLIFIRGTDGGIYALPYGGIYGNWVRLAGGNDRINNAPGATSRGSQRFDVFGRGTDNRIYQIFQ